MGTSGDIRRIGATRAAFNLQLDSAGARVAHGCAPRRRSARRAALSCRARPRRRPRALARQWAGLEREAGCCATRSLTTSLGTSPSDSQRPGTPAADGAHGNRAERCATTPSRRDAPRGTASDQSRAVSRTSSRDLALIRRNLARTHHAPVPRARDRDRLAGARIDPQAPALRGRRGRLAGHAVVA
jgi:hypothetical protein